MKTKLISILAIVCFLGFTLKAGERTEPVTQTTAGNAKAKIEENTEETGEVIPESEENIQKREESSYASAYIEKIRQLEKQEDDYRYDLIFVDENIVPELAVSDLFGNVSLYGWKNGSLHTLLDNWDSGGFRVCTYVPYQNLIYTLDISEENRRILECYRIDDEGSVIKDHALIQAYTDDEYQLKERDDESIEMSSWSYFYFDGADQGSYELQKGQPLFYADMADYIPEVKHLYLEGKTTGPVEWRYGFYPAEEVLERLERIKNGTEKITEDGLRAVERMLAAREKGYTIGEGFYTLEGSLLTWFWHVDFDFRRVEEFHLVRDYHLCRTTLANIDVPALEEQLVKYVEYDQEMREKEELASPLHIDYHPCDVNDDGLRDYLVCIDGYLFSGSGGHVTELYVQEKGGSYRKVMSLNLRLRGGEESWQHAYFSLLEEKNHGFFTLLLPSGKILRYDKRQECYEFEEEIEMAGTEERKENVENILG